MLREPCLGNSIASAQGTIISLLPDSMTAESNLGSSCPE